MRYRNGSLGAGLASLATVGMVASSCGLSTLSEPTDRTGKNGHPRDADAEVPSTEEPSSDDEPSPADEPSPGDGTGPSDPEERYHPEAYAGASLHGPDTRLQMEDCTSCHGENLEGGESQVSCDPCHQPEWRTDCIYCHGGDANETGAPPRDIDGEDHPDSITFRAHTTHVSQTTHRALACMECHEQPTDVLSLDHVFDDSPGVAEVYFGQGLASGAVYDGLGGCSNVYCHGTGGAVNGESQDDGRSLDCEGCHPSVESGPDEWAQMSGEHALHLQEGMACADCHNRVVDTSEAIVSPWLHVDGEIDSVFSEPYIAIDAGTCTGVCHSKVHFWTSWD
jgi:predicted CxxxxCH...CXXCH cytochrome family protein